MSTDAELARRRLTNSPPVIVRKQPLERSLRITPPDENR